MTAHESTFPPNCPPFNYHAFNKEDVCDNCGAHKAEVRDIDEHGLPLRKMVHVPLAAPHGSETEYVDDIMTALHAGLFVYGGLSEIQRDAVRGALASAFATGWREGSRHMASELGADMSGDGIVVPK